MFPPTRVWPWKYEKITEKKQKYHFRAIFVFLSVIFSYFQGPTRGGGFWKFFELFFAFPALGGFCVLYEPNRIATVDAYVLGGGGGVQNQAEKKIEKYFSAGKYQIYRKFSETLSETLSEDFPLRDSRSCCP